MNCDDILELYIDDVKQSLPTSEANNYNVPSTVTIPNNTYIIAAKCWNKLGGPKGLIGSLIWHGGVDVVTNEDWWCSKTNTESWTSKQFDVEEESGWAPAIVISRARESYNGPISVNASYIFASTGSVAYCRINLFDSLVGE